VVTIPYEAQERPDGCAAAALAMVYRSLGLACAQAELWPRVSGRVRGAPRGKTHLLCQDALSRGLRAAIVRASSPWPALRACFAAGIRVILHHRLSEGDGSGHYSVLAGLEGASLSLHDPLLGPGRALGQDEFLRLWGPRGREGVGHVLVAVAASAGEMVCDVCGEAWPEAIPCAGCGGAVGLRPAEALGCLADGCAGRRWAECYCPACDMGTWWLRKRGEAIA
jgi:hypothetical protein